MLKLRHLLWALALPLLILSKSYAVVDAPTGQFQAANCTINELGFIVCDGPLISLSSSSSSSTTSSTSTSSSSTSTSSSSTSSSSSSGAPSYAFVVNNSAELASAIGSVTAGQSILLNNGSYGDLTIAKGWTNYVTLVAANKHQAVFGNVIMDGATRGYVRFEGLSVNSFDFRNNAHHLQMVGNLVRKIIYFNIANDILIHNNEIRTYLSGTTGSTHSTLLNAVKNIVVTHNYIGGATQDLMRITGASENIVIRKNMFYNTMPNRRPDLGGNGCEYDHTDAIQGFGVGSDNPKDMVIEQNFFFDDPDDNDVRTGCGDGRITMQGVFLSDPKGAGYVNVTVRNNYFYIGSPNTIYFQAAAENVIVENNSLLGWSYIEGVPGGGGGSVRIIEKTGYTNAGLTLRGNIARAISDETTSWSPVPGQNVTYAAANVRDYFPIGNGHASTWQHFIPVPGSLAASFGAFAEILAIQAGTTPPPGVLQ